MTVAPVPGNGPSLFQARRTGLSVIKLQLNCHDKGTPRECSERASEGCLFVVPCCTPPHEGPPRSKTANLPIEKVVVRGSKTSAPMSALGHKQPSARVRVMSALPPKADIG